MRRRAPVDLLVWTGVFVACQSVIRAEIRWLSIATAIAVLGALLACTGRRRTRIALAWMLVAASSAALALLWQLRTPEDPGGVSPAAADRWHAERPIQSLTWQHDGRLLMVRRRQGGLEIADARSGERLAWHDGETDWGERAFAAGELVVLRLAAWRGRPVRTRVWSRDGAEPRGGSPSERVSPDGRWLVGAAGGLRVRETTARARVRRLPTPWPAGSSTTLAFLPSGRLAVVAASRDTGSLRRATVLDLATGSVVRAIELPGEPLRSPVHAVGEDALAMVTRRAGRDALVVVSLTTGALRVVLADVGPLAGDGLLGVADGRALLRDGQGMTWVVTLEDGRRVANGRPRDGWPDSMTLAHGAHRAAWHGSGWIHTDEMWSPFARGGSARAPGGPRAVFSRRRAWLGPVWRNALAVWIALLLVALGWTWTRPPKA